jgi:hypothetical protein
MTASSCFSQPPTPNGGFCRTVASDSRSTNDVVMFFVMSTTARVEVLIVK